MTPALFLAHAVLALGWLALAQAGEGLRTRASRVFGAAGVVLALVVVLLRESLPAWRGIDIDPTSAAVAGVAIASAWGLVLSLDLGSDRWWVGALTGVASTGLLFVAGSVWTAVTLLFLACCAAPTYVALARAGRAAWLSVAVADAALVVALVSDALTNERWDLPSSIGGGMLAPLLIAVTLRVGLIPRLTTPLRSPAAALVPITSGLGFVMLLRVVERPAPIAAVAALLIAVAAVAWSVLRRKLDPALVVTWPAASAVGLCLATTQASAAAAVWGLLGITAVVLWPDALERGRLARGFLLSVSIPNVAFGALATAAVGSFARAGAGGPVYQVIAWNVLSALFPLACAAGVALGVFAARAERRGGYHPEAVFMTWILMAGSVLTGMILGTGAVYEVVGGVPAMILFSVALAVGVLVAVRAPGDGNDTGTSAVVDLSPVLELAPWSAAVSLTVIAGTAGTAGWLIVRGLQVGFL